MILQKTPKKPAFEPSFDLTRRDTLVLEVQRIVCLAGCSLLCLALVSYSPADPSWSTWTSRGHFQNWMGRAGSITADVCFQLMGMGAFALALLICLPALRRRRKESRPWWWRLSPALFLLAFSSVAQTGLRRDWTPWRLQNPGGLMGRLVTDGLGYGIGHVGCWIVSLAALAAATILVFEWDLVGAISAFIRRVVAKSTAAADASRARLQALGPKLNSLVAGAWPKRQPTILPEPPVSIPRALQPPPLPGATAAATPVSAATPLPPIAKRFENEEDEFEKLAAHARVRTTSSVAPSAKRSSLIDFQLPGLDLLSGRADSKTKTVDKSWYLEKANILVQKLKDFGVEGEVVHISPGPVITVYEFKPASGVKIKEIANLSDDLTLALSVLSVRIVAPIPGKPVVGIEIPSPHREMVFFKDMIQETSFYNGEMRIPVVLGRLASGEPVVAGLASMPHLLVAGSTGTGKSVFINTLISSLLYRYTPQQLKLILVDPKMVELSTYEGIPHLLLPVVVDSKKAAQALRWTVDEMERRYSMMHQSGVRHVDAYNERWNGQNDEDHPFLPYIVVVIDEYADLMAVVPKDVELSIARLAQKARASGIHLVLATQRPSTDVVTGTIKANFPSRISFRVASSVDSKTILDRTGADRLLGNGDMLFHSAGFMSLKRMQGAFISDADLQRVVDFLKAQGAPEYDERILAAAESDPEEISSAGDHEEGQLYDRAVALVREKGEASISLIQRHLKIGYNRAASLMEEMEKQGIVAQAIPGAAKRRAVLTP